MANASLIIKQSATAFHFIQFIFSLWLLQNKHKYTSPMGAYWWMRIIWLMRIHKIVSSIQALFVANDDNGMIAVSWGNKSDKIHNMPCLIIISVWHIGNVHQHKNTDTHTHTLANQARSWIIFISYDQYSFPFPMHNAFHELISEIGLMPEQITCLMHVITIKDPIAMRIRTNAMTLRLGANN